MNDRKRIQHKAHAIIIGLDSIQGLQTARLLSDRGVQVIGIAKSANHYGVRTKVCERVIITDTSGEELIHVLEDLGQELRLKSVLFPCQDKNVLLISQYRKFLDRWYNIVLPGEEIVEMMLDKAKFYAFAEKEALPIPTTFVLKSREDTKRAAERVSYPCILKPPWRPETWTNHTKTKAVIIDNPTELMESYDHYHQWAEVLVVQEWIWGDEGSHFTCNCYIGVNQEVLAAITTRKIRQWPPKTGQACLSEEIQNDDVLEETLKLFKSVPYRGLGYLEMKRDERSGKLLIVEPNVGRPTGRAATAEASGVELVYTMYCDALGLPLPSHQKPRQKGVKWIHLLRDLQSAIHYWRNGELSFLEWWKSIKGQKTFAIFSWRDPAPFFFAVIRVVPTLLSPRERGKQDYQSIQPQKI